MFYAMRQRTKAFFPFTLVLLILFTASNLFAEKSDNNILFKQGIEYLKAQEYGKSKDVFQKLVKKAPENALYWFNLGNCNFMLKDYSKAVHSYTRVVRLKSPLSSAAILYGAKSYRNLTKFEMALKLLNHLAKKDLRPALKDEVEVEKETLKKAIIEEGVKNYGEGIYKEALINFDMALSIGPSDKAVMMKGLTLLRIGKSRDAKEEFDKIAKKRPDARARTPLVRDAKYFSNMIDEGKWLPQKPYWMFLDFRGGYDSNIYRDGISETRVASPRLEMDLGAGYQFSRKRPWVFRMAYNFGWDEATNTGALRFISNTVKGYAAFDNRSWIFQLRSSFEHDILDFGSFLMKPAVGCLVEKSFGKQKIGITYDYQRNISADALYDYLAGNLHTASFYWSLRERRLFLDPYFLFFLEDIGDLALTTGTLPLANASFGPGLRVTWYFAYLWSVSAGVLYLYKDYRNIATPENINRTDHQASGTVRIARGIVPSLRVFGDFGFTVNKSTLGATSVDDKNYNQLVLIAGISWDILP